MSHCGIARRVLFAAAVILVSGGLASSAGVRPALPLFQAAPTLVGHWPLNTIDTVPDPDTTPDIVGTAPLSLNLGPNATGLAGGSAVSGNGIQMDGVDDFLATAAAPAALNFGTGSFSVALWFRPDGTGVKRLINKWDGPAQQGWLLDVHSTTTGTAAVGTFRFILDTSTTGNTVGTDRAEFGIAAGLDSGIWRHVAFVVDRTNTRIQLFLDGVQVGANQTIPASLTTADNAMGLAVGTITNSLGAHFGGGVDDVRIYSGALSPGEVDTLYSGGFSRIGVGNPAPVIRRRGLMGEYYNNNATIVNTMTPPGSPDATPSTTATLALTRIDPAVWYDWGGGSPAAGINADDFFGVWTAQIRTPNLTGNYQFRTITDDGVRVRVNNVVARNDWTDQGPAANPEVGTDIALNADTVYDIRVDLYERAGGAVMKLYWLLPGATTPEIISPPFLIPPGGPAAPTGLTAVASTNSTTPQVVVNWTAPAGLPAATGYIVSRATTSGGPYTQVAVQAGTSFTDTTVAFGTAYYYIVQATSSSNCRIGPATAQTPAATPIQPVILVSPAGPLATVENGTLNAQLTFTVNVTPVGSPGNVQITSNDATEALLILPGGTVPSRASPVNLVIPAGTPVGTNFVVTVYGEDDFVADGARPYTISFAISGPGAWATATLPPITGSNGDNDTPSINVTQLSGPTTESGGTATFDVVFGSQPTVDTTVTVTSMNPAEATVTQTTLTFTVAAGAPNGYDTIHTVQVVGADDAALDFAQPFSINVEVTGGDPAYVALTATPGPGPVVRGGVNLDNEAIPTLDPVWGGNGSGGGCGLTGLEAALLLGLAGLLRRRTR